jgi:hypothetical protein
MAITSVNLDIAKRVDITCRKGDTFSLEFIVKDSDGTALNVTTPSAYTFKMEVRETDTTTGTATIATTGDTSSGFNILGTSEGIVTVSSAASNMATVESGIYVYDLQATKVDDSSVQTWFYGLFKINEDVAV